MHLNIISVGVVASTLVSSAVASSVQDLTALEGRMVLGPGFMVPIDKTEDEYDVNAPWMVPVVDYVNQDTNETIFDAAGYDIASRDIESDLEKRAGGMRFWLGRKHVDVGCGATVDSVRNMFGAAVYALCKGGNCSSAMNGKYVRQVTWMGNGSKRIGRYLEFTGSGKYTGDATLGNMHNAAKAAVRRETVAFAWRKWLSPDWWIADEECKMAKFPAYISMDKGAPNTINNVEITVKLQEIDNNCLTEEILSIVAGGIHAALGVGFGVVHAMCARGK